MRRGIVIVVALAGLAVAGCGDEQEYGGDSGSAKQYELAREIGRNACREPLHPARAKVDPVGYAEEQFGGDGEFDTAREMGCLEALAP